MPALYWQIVNLIDAMHVPTLPKILRSFGLACMHSPLISGFCASPERPVFWAMNGLNRYIKNQCFVYLLNNFKIGLRLRRLCFFVLTAVNGVKAK